MRSRVHLQQLKKCIILFLVGTICSILSCAIYIFNPFKMILDYNLQMRPDSFAYSLWKKPPIDVLHKVYIFNITNSVEFLEGTEKLKLKEIGPYVYQEFLDHTNITFNDNGTITCIPRRTVFFVLELSKSDPKKDFITVPNIPMLGIESALSNAGFLINFPIIQLINMLGIKPIVNITAHDYLWGYEDQLVKLATDLMPSYYNFKKFGILDRMYDEGENIVNINIRNNNNTRDENERYMSIQTYNGSPGLSHWGYLDEEENITYPENTYCNRIRGATEGGIFPTNPDKRAIFRVYRQSFCRTVPLVYKEDIFCYGDIPSYLYTISEDFLDPPDINHDNECYSRKLKKFLRKGLSILTPCYYNIPSAVSLPHFLNGDPSLLNEVEGLQPDAEKHSSQVVIQPDIGFPIKFNSRIQTNLLMHKTQYNSKIQSFNDKTIPLIWSDMAASLSSYWVLKLRLTVIVLPIAQTILMYLLIIIGVSLIALSLVPSIWVFNQHRNKQSELVKNDNADLKIPLKYDQNTTIQILSKVKYINSKSDLYS